MDDVDIATDVAHVARIYDYMLGGTTNFEVDRRAAERAAEPMGGMPAVRFSTRSNRAFLGRAVRRIVEDHGIRQFLDLGSGIPTMDNVHEVAQRAAPECKVVYVDFEPIVTAHAHMRRGDAGEGAIDYIIEDIRNVETVLGRAAETLDFTQPVGVLMFTILHNLRTDEDPWALVRRYMDAVPSGSYLASSNLTGDFTPEAMAETKAALDEDMAEPFVLRTHEEIARFYDGLEFIEPGLVNVNEWHPDDGIPAMPDGVVVAPIYGGVARKP
jgi:S-adenosyl methyltransferase